MIISKRIFLLLVCSLVLVCAPVFAQERPADPYFVVYSHYMEEPGSLDIEVSPAFGHADGIHSFAGVLNEFEYGATRWWTTEFYLDWQHTTHEGNLYTGYRFENRFRPFLEKHWINPVLYVEYESINGGDKTLKEIVGFDGKADLQVPNSEAREEHEHELEGKLILSSDFGLWNLSENFIAEKNLNGGPWEFGYAVGASRPIAAPKGTHCTFCAERLSAGVEVYGGLGEWGAFTLGGTSQYIAPTIQWTLPSETTIRFSPGWGITDESVETIFRVGVSQEIDSLGKRIAHVFRH